MSPVGSPTQLEVRLRSGAVEDAPEIGRICYEAFNSIAKAHNYPPDIPSAQFAVDVLSRMLSHPKIYSVVAESKGRIIGSNFLDERGTITGVGPITVDPPYQNSGAGRELMLDVMRRSAATGAAGCRLVQIAYNRRSLALYSKLGFEAREPLSNLQGKPPREKIEGREVRAASADDIEACNRLCEAVHGHNRGGEVTEAVGGGDALVVEHGGKITGYSTGLAFFAHSVGESNEDIIALISHADSFGGPGILVPTRNYTLLRWGLLNGLRINQQATLMTTGLYNEPRGAYLPSILF